MRPSQNIDAIIFIQTIYKYFLRARLMGTLKKFLIFSMHLRFAFPNCGTHATVATCSVGMATTFSLTQQVFH